MYQINQYKVTTNQWVFLSLRHNQTTGDWAFDVDNNRVTLSSVSFDDGDSVLTIGRNPNFDVPFIGRIDNVFVFNRFLSNQEIDTIRTGGSEAILSLSSSAAPEPGTMSLLLLGALPFLVRRVRK
ncbi:MAG: hypothetical protein OHK0029_01710 [Armatimonadaceae bacterium]